MSENRARQLQEEDIHAIVCLLMDRTGITDFPFTIKELMAVKGRIALNHDESSTNGYVMKRII